MKKSTLALMMMGFVASTATQAAEVYNKNANKLDVYGKIKAMHYFSDYDSKDGDQTYVRFGIKGETQINDDLTGYGRWESEFSGNKTGERLQSENPSGVRRREAEELRLLRLRS